MTFENWFILRLALVLSLLFLAAIMFVIQEWRLRKRKREAAKLSHERHPRLAEIAAKHLLEQASTTSMLECFSKDRRAAQEDKGDTRTFRRYKPLSPSCEPFTEGVVHTRPRLVATLYADCPKCKRALRMTWTEGEQKPEMCKSCEDEVDNG